MFWTLVSEHHITRTLSLALICHPSIYYSCFHTMSPIGQVQSRKSMQEVIRFVSERRLFLLADEVDVLKHYRHIQA